MEEELSNIVSFMPTKLPRVPDRADCRIKDMRLEVKYNVCYIVAGIAIDEAGRVLMIQEAKPSCRGSWYLPAGRMEKNESIISAVKREVLEESGLVFEPTALICVESQSLYWTRFTLIGVISGGALKTPEQEDSESIQASWMSEEQLKLQRIRAHDCLRLIQLAQQWHTSGHRLGGVPVEVPHVSASLRLVVTNPSNCVLVNHGISSSTSLPCGLLERKTFSYLVEEILKDCGYNGQHTVEGLLSLEYSGIGKYGYCLTVLVKAHDDRITKTSSQQQWEWQKLPELLLEKIGSVISGDTVCAKFLEL